MLARLFQAIESCATTCFVQNSFHEETDQGKTHIRCRWVYLSEASEEKPCIREKHVVPSGHLTKCNNGCPDTMATWARLFRLTRAPTDGLAGTKTATTMREYKNSCTDWIFDVCYNRVARERSFALTPAECRKKKEHKTDGEA